MPPSAVDVAKGGRSVSDAEHAPDALPVVPLIPMRRWFMAVTLLLLNVIDVYLTKAVIRLGGVEANPVMRPIIDDPLAPIVLKVVISLGVGLLLLSAPRVSRLADWSVGLVLVGYTMVMGWNLGILLQSMGPSGTG